MRGEITVNEEVFPGIYSIREYAAGRRGLV